MNDIHEVNALLLNQLSDEDWAETKRRALLYAREKARKSAWLGWAVEPEELWQEALHRIYGRGEVDGKSTKPRTWDRTRCPDLVVLVEGVIRSIVSDLAKHYSKFRPVAIEATLDPDRDPDRSYVFEDKVREARRAADETFTDTPEDIISREESGAALRSFLADISSADPEVRALLQALNSVGGKPRELAEATGFEVGVVNNLKKRLKRHVRQFVLNLGDPRLEAYVLHDEREAA